MRKLLCRVGLIEVLDESIRYVAAFFFQSLRSCYEVSVQRPMLEVSESWRYWRPVWDQREVSFSVLK